MASKSKLKFTKDRMGASPAHFFASSIGAWNMGENMEELITVMKNDGLPFSLWYVPLALDAEYEIACYQPQVEGACFLGLWKF